jgi:hypothetical protein
MKKTLFILLTLAIVAGASAQKPEAVAVKTQGMAVTIDGVLDEAIWQNAEKYLIEKVFKGESITDSADCYGFFQVAWNEDGIFVAVTVTDDSTNVTGPQGADWAWDMVEMYFDMNVGNLNDSIGASSSNSGHHQIAGLAKDGINNWKSKSSYAYKTNGSNYVKETFASWKDLLDKNGKVHAAADTLEIGFDIYIIDNDRDSTASGRQFRDRLVWANKGDSAENWSYMNDAGILKFDMSSENAVDNEFVTIAQKVKGVPLTIDGILDEPAWAKAPKYNITQVYKGEEIEGAEDCSGYFQVMWNYEGIFVAVTVTDDSTNVTGPQGANWAWDMVEIYFDMNAGNLNDSIGASSSGSGHYQVAGLAIDGINNWNTVSKYAYKTNGSNYVKETFASWKDLKNKDGKVLTPVDTLEIGFDVYIIDNDRDSTSSGRQFRDRLVWANRGDSAENWGYMNDAGIMKFNMGAAIENRVPLTVKKVTGDTIIIDGNLEESIWTDLPKINIAQVYKGEYHKGPQDCSGYFQIAWNEDGLYVAVTVTDDSTNVTGPQGADWAWDMVEMYFDMNVGNLQDKVGASAGKGHYQIAGLAKDGINNWKTASKYAYKTNGSKYVKETFASWADLKNVSDNVVAPANNMQLGFDVYIIDNDRDSTASGRQFRDRLVWSNWGDINENWNNMDDAGVIKLSTTAIENVYNPFSSITEVKSLGNAVVYPNPAKDVLYIRNVSEKVVVRIFSVEGKIMMQSNEGATSINISSLQQGIYLIRISDQGQETINRIVVY